MKAYILSILLTSLCILLAQKFKTDKSKFLSIIFLIIGLFICCYIAGVRSINTGTDIKVYVIRLFNESVNSSFWSFIKNSNTDFLFGTLVYTGAISNNINFVLFLIELSVALPIFIYAYLDNDGNNMFFIITIFLLTMYVVSLNLMRQSIAISLDILSFYFISTNKVKTGLILFLSSLLFHKTAFIFPFVYILYVIVKSTEKRKYLYLFFLTILMLLVSVFGNQIISHSIYYTYLNNTGLMRAFSWGSILKSFFWVMISGIAVIYKKKSKEDWKVEISFLLFFYSFLLILVSFKIPGMGRLSYYFTDLALILYIPIIPTLFKQKVFMKAICLLTLGMLWWNMTFIPNDPARVYPYESEVATYLND